MPIADRKPLTADTLLDAATAVVLAHGIGALTLDAVAQQAKVSKGGLLHHYRSKEALMYALVERTVAQWRADWQAAANAEPAGPGRLTRGLLRLCLTDSSEWSEAHHGSCKVCIAALANDAKLLAPMRTVHQELLAAIARDGLPAGVGEVVMLTLHGLWYEWIFGLNEVDDQRLRALRRVLEQLVAAAHETDVKSIANPAAV